MAAFSAPKRTKPVPNRPKRGAKFLFKIQNFGFESRISKSRKLNKNSPSKIEGVPVRGRECAFEMKVQR